tara:strand:- start:397 stop:1350 length:954 start_codon:yes stop_codon:yes gene_type:complete
MKFKISAVIVLCLCVAVTFSGCLDMFSSGCESDAECEGNNCIKGECVKITFRAAGVGAELLKDSPPSKILVDPLKSRYDRTPFDIYLQLTNIGEHTIPPDELTISLSGGNFDKSGDTWTNDEPIRGAEAFEDFGDVVFVEEFKGARYSGSPNFGGAPFTVVAEIKYNYKTTALGSICIIGANDETPFCKETGNKLSKVYSAPVTVRSIKEELYPESITAGITVENVGGGELCRMGTECGKDDKRYVKLESFKMGGKDYVALGLCDTEKRLKSEDKTGQFVCKGISRADTSTKEETAEIVLSYQYRSALQRTVRAYEL